MPQRFALDKMDASLQTTFSNAFLYLYEWKALYWISLKFVSKDPNTNKSALVQVMAWHRTGDKPLSEPMLPQFTDAYMRH